MSLDIGALDTAVQRLHELLRDGLRTCDIWDRRTGLSLAGYQSQPAAVALLTQITADLDTALHDSGLPHLRHYCLLHLDHDTLLLLIPHGNDLLQGVLLDARKVNLGLLMAVVLPQMLEMVARARQPDTGHRSS